MKETNPEAIWAELVRTGFQQLQPADIVLTRSKRGLLGRLIRHFLRRQGDPVVYNHIAGYVGSGRVVEALSRVVERSLGSYFTGDHCVKIVRNRTWPRTTRRRIVARARARKGRPYGLLKVAVLQALDNLFRTNRFTATFSITPLPYCSQLWATVVYEETAARINDVPPKSCEPDDFDDEVQKNPDRWETVLEL